uniref:HOOK N-terminal domain-containing protein n=1 Tax=Ciona savignyi TaxID=51511 RepID=H2ZQI9_CIOSA
VMSLPKVLMMVHNFRTQEGLAEMQKLLLLVLGCAVQCDQRERFVEKMKQLTYEGMETMMNHIKDVILNLQWEELVEIPADDLEELTRKMSLHIRSLVSERDKQAMVVLFFSQLITDMTQERDYFQSQAGGGGSQLIRKESFTATRQHLIVELNDFKAKLRKAKQELDDKVEQNIDLKSEIEEMQLALKEIRQENSSLVTEARSTRALRDENDILKERAGKASKLEFEIEILREKVKDVDFYKQRVEELRDDNKILHETKALVEEQLKKQEPDWMACWTSEKRIVDLNRKLQAMTQEHENDQRRIQSLSEKVSNLEFDKMQSMNESGNLAYQLEQARGNIDSGRMSILDESEESTLNRALRLEKENKRLQALMAKYQDATKTHEITQASMLELEKENQRLSNRVQQLQEHINKVRQSVLDFEQLSTDLAADRQRLESSLETARASSERRVQEMEQENNHLVLSELVQDMTTKHHKLEYETKRLNEKIHDMEDSIHLAKEVQKMELESQLERVRSQLEVQKERLIVREREINEIEVENEERLTNEVQRAKTIVETKTGEFEESLEKITTLTRFNKILSAETEELRVTVTRLNETEVELKKLQTQQAVEKRTLTQLREDLVTEKLTSHQRLTQLESLNTELQKIGLSRDELQQLNNDSDNDKRFRALESKLDSTLKRSLEAKEEKIDNQQKLLFFIYFSHPTDTQARLRVAVTAPPGGSTLKSSSQDLQSHVKSLQSQVSNLHKQQDRLQQNYDNLQKQHVQLQVDNSALQSKCTSLVQQNALASSAQSTTESSKSQLRQQLNSTTKQKEQLEKENDDLAVQHERQTMELEGVRQDHQKLKELYQKLRIDVIDSCQKLNTSTILQNQELEGKYNSTLRRSNEAMSLKDNETSLTSQDLDALKQAHDKLNKSYKNLFTEYDDLQSDHASLKQSNNRLKIEYAKLEAETTDIRQLDIATAKLSNRCEVLMQLKGNLEDENRHLLEQISRLMSHNEELLSQALEGKDQIYTEQKQYNERMQEIRRQKEKLEEKIMDLYR